MKNKLLVSVFAVAIASFALTSCETKSNVTEVCTDMVKESMHKYARSLVQLDGQALTISEYEFLGKVDDSRMVYRTLSFGNGSFKPLQVDTLSYQYGEWNEDNTEFSLLITPATGDPYTLIYKGNAFITPDGRSIGGEGTENSARAEKWNKVIASISNTEWEAAFYDEYVLDSIFRDSIRTRFIPAQGGLVTDTIQVFSGKMDTLSADTACYYPIELKHDPATLANTGHFRQRSVRTTYDRDTKTESIESEKVDEYDCNWYFSDVSSDAKFSIVLLNTTTPDAKPVTLSISKYKMDDAAAGQEFLLGGLTYTRP